jgi:hypothetical protein
LLCSVGSGTGPADFGDKGGEDGVPRTDEPLLGAANIVTRTWDSGLEPGRSGWLVWGANPCPLRLVPIDR